MGQLVPLPITPPPGLVLTETERTAEGRWIQPWNWFRFMKGMPQKMGGWAQAFTTATSGIPHAILCWTDLIINRFVAAGTYRKLYVYDQYGVQNDITPYRATGSLTNPFTTSNGSSTVTVASSSHGLSIGDTVYFPSVASTIGTTITPAILEAAAGFVVTSVIDANDYQFSAGIAATSVTTLGGGAVTYDYEIPIGTENSTLGLGWGVGGWGLGTWGSPRATSTIVFEARVWSLDHFGKLLMAGYNGSTTIYQFDPTQNQPWPRAQAVSNLAAYLTSLGTSVRGIIVTPERFILVLCENLIVTASNQGDYNTWAPATANTAFTRTLTEGTKLIGGVPMSPFNTMVLTDGAAFLFQYTGDSFIYRSSLVGKDCGLVGSNAITSADGQAFWMGSNNFHMFDGSTHPMPNVEDIRKYIFDNLNISGQFQITADFSPTFNEIWFFLPLFGSATPNYLLIFHRNDQCWTLHPNMTRASMSHFSSGDTRPYLGDISGLLYQHENTEDGAGSPITAEITLSPYALREGDQAVDVEGMIFDVKDQVGNIALTVNTYDYINDTSPTIEDTETDTLIPSGQGRTDIRVAGRYIGFSAIINTLGSYFRLGRPVAFIRPTARRR